MKANSFHTELHGGIRRDEIWYERVKIGIAVADSAIYYNQFHQPR